MAFKFNCHLKLVEMEINISKVVYGLLRPITIKQRRNIQLKKTIKLEMNKTKSTFRLFLKYFPMKIFRY